MIFQTVREAEAPLRPKDLARSAGKKGEEVKTLLSEGAARGQIFNWGSARAPAYWHRDPRQEARARLLAVAASESLGKDDLAKRAVTGPPKLVLRLVSSVREDLIREKRFVIASMAGSTAKRVVDREHPEPFLQSEIARLIKRFGCERPRERIEALLAPEPARPLQEKVDDVAAKMFAAMNRIAFSPGATVTFHRLRQQPDLAEIPKEIFDAAALLLQRERKALLSLHDHAPALAAEERERFVTDGLGTYYVSIYAR